MTLKTLATNAAASKYQIVPTSNYQRISLQKMRFVSRTTSDVRNKPHPVPDFSRLGKPTDNAFIESFNGSFRDECLNVNWFLSLKDAKEKINAFKEEYNHFRPHSALGNLTPIEAIDWHHEARKSLL
jgi:putative transposase